MSDQSVKRIVCLANSRMGNGRCIAGRELLADGRPGAWIRPVSGSQDEGVKVLNTRYASGGFAKLLDVMDVPVREAQPQGHQSENWLLDKKRQWAKVKRVRPTDLPTMLDAPDQLWVNGSRSATGQNNRVSPSDVSSLHGSLYFIKASLQLEVLTTGADFGKPAKRVQGLFEYGGTEYSLRVTDHEYERKYRPRPNGEFEIGECFLTVSLAGAPFYGYFYKLIAGVIKA